MNWPPLSAETSKELAKVLEEAVKSKPKDLLEHVASRLERASGWNMAEFEAYFEECRKMPRTYKLEDRCPEGQDPILWVPTRYSDDTILESLRNVVGELIKRFLEPGDALMSPEELLEAAPVAYPELAYLPPGTQGRLRAETMLRTVSVLVAEVEGLDVRTEEFQLANPVINGQLAGWARDRLRTGLRKSAEMLDAVVVCILVGLIGTDSEAFQERYASLAGTKGGGRSEDLAVRVMRRAPTALPSFRRLSPQMQRLVEAVRIAGFPFQELLTAEALPSHLATAKDILIPYDSGITFLISTMIIEQIVSAGVELLSDVQLRSVELVKFGAQALAAVEKYSAQKAYELFLKKRAEQVDLRVVRDDYLQRACVRICCMALARDREDWDAVEKAVHEMPENEKEVLKRELGMKDGTATGPGADRGPTFAMTGASRYLLGARLNRQVNIWPGPAVKVLCRLLEDAARSYSQSKERMLNLNLDGLADFTHHYAGAGFDDIFFLLEENSASGGITVRVTG